MKTLLKSVLIISLSASISSAQLPPDTLWTKIIDHTVISAQQTHDEGLILLCAESGNNYPEYIIRCDDSGNTLWTRSYDLNCGDIITGSSFFSFAIETKDLGFIVGCCCGSGREYFMYHDHRLLKLNSDGDSLWISIDSEGYGINWIEQTSDQGFITTGYSDYSVKEGTTRKYKDNGDTLWTKDYGGFCIVETSDNGYLLTGSSAYEAAYGDVTLLKMNEYGDSLWMKIYNKYDISREIGKQILKTSDGGFIILSEYNYMEPDHSYTWLIKTNEMGDTTWTKSFEETYNYIQQTTDSGYILIGDWEETVLGIIKLNKYGDRQWYRSTDRSLHLQGIFIEQCSDNGYIAVARGDTNTTIMRFGTDPYLQIQENKFLPTTYKLHQNYPNPFNPSTKIEFTLPKSEFVELKVYNILGKEVATLVSKNLNQGNHTYQFDGKNLASGIYYYQLVAGDFHQVKKMILIK